MNPAQRNNMFTQLIPNLAEIPNVTFDEIVSLWRRDDYEAQLGWIYYKPTISLLENVYRYKDLEEIIRWPRLIKPLRTTIISYLLEDDYVCSFAHLVAGPRVQVLTYTHPVDRRKDVAKLFPSYFADLRTMRQKELSVGVLMPFIRIIFSETHLFYYGHISDAVHNGPLMQAINNRFSGESQPTCFRLLESNVIDWNVLCGYRATDASVRNFEYDDLHPNVRATTDLLREAAGCTAVVFYLVFHKTERTWSQCRTDFLADGLPLCIVDRLKQSVRDRVGNFGARMTAAFDAGDNCWTLLWNESRLILNINPIDAAAISPEYYLREPTTEPTYKRGFVRAPKFVTRKDYGILRQYAMSVEVWTGRARWNNRIYEYEYRVVGSEGVWYLPESDLKLKRFNRNVKRAPAIPRRVKKYTEPTSLATILQVNLERTLSNGLPAGGAPRTPSTHDPRATAFANCVTALKRHRFLAREANLAGTCGVGLYIPHKVKNGL